MEANPLAILCGDALEQLRTLPSESVHCCVTSPPYWGLRDYGTAQWDGGSEDCDHSSARPPSADSKQATNCKGEGSRDSFAGRDCRKCGAKRIDSQLGLEKTPEEYVGKMVEVFREVRRVLRKDGTLWLNLGDSYYGANWRGSEAIGVKQATNRGANASPHAMNPQAWRNMQHDSLKPKDLCGIPWRVAFALQADGWWLRQDIIWSKPNPMPAAWLHRCTKAHEYLFLLTKSANYFYDAEAIKERSETEPYAAGYTSGDSYAIGPMSRNGNSQREGDQSRIWGSTSRNKRSVWTVATAPYPEAHFATYPPDLIKPCILAGTSAKGCCAKCGAPWERVTERGETTMRTPNDGKGYIASISQERPGLGAGILPNAHTEIKTVGWEQTCRCRLPYTVWGGGPQSTEPCTVLDPFAGSGTTGAVAIELGRKAILIELNPKYVELIKQRCNVTMGLALA